MRNLVYRGLTYEFSDGGKSHVVGEQVAGHIAFVRHRFELNYFECLTVLARTQLCEPYFSVVGKIKEDDDNEQDRGSEYENEEREKSVEERFDDGGIQNYSFVGKGKVLTAKAERRPPLRGATGGERKGIQRFKNC